MAQQERDATGDEIAIIGMAGRFSKAADVEAFWRNIRDGVECVTFFTDEELLAAGTDPEELKHPAYVRAKGVLEDTEMFDAAFFGFNPREAEIMDPQTRHFLETAWTAMEHAGYDPERTDCPVGVYAGGSQSSYMLWNVMVNPQALFALGPMQANLLTSNGFISTWTSYKLNLRGPSINVSTACSTGLVAVHTACQALLNGECGMALAGSVGISVPVVGGYVYDEGGISSADGHTRSFDADAKGTLSGSGVGIVVLKRLDDALNDGDTVYAVIRGSALNNDGSMKIGYTAPSVDGQAEVIAEAQAIAGVKPTSVGMIECHGSATPLGDPIEVAALTQAFKGSGARPGSVAIGSVKSNLGHLDSGAGIAGLLKAVQALRHKQLPPSLNYVRPNPQIDFAAGPFYVNTELRPWERGSTPRRAGVSSFGIGGTNAHVVLEEAPEAEVPSDRPWQLVVLSARTPTALDAATRNLVGWLRENPDAPLADAAHTLQMGRRMFAHRRAVVARDTADAASALASMNPGRVATGHGEPEAHPVAFLFPGEGIQHAGMGAELYHEEPAFRDAMDECLNALRPLMDEDLRPLFFPRTEEEAADFTNRMHAPAMSGPAVFTVEYALAKLWMSWGIEPESMVGHDVGEYVAAALSGALGLEDALRLVAARGKALSGLGQGMLLFIGRPESEVRPLLGPSMHLLSVDGPTVCIATGSFAAAAEAEARFAAAGVQVGKQPLPHVADPEGLARVAAEFEAVARTVRGREPETPFLSTVTGARATAADLADGTYWVRHLTSTVRFNDAVKNLFDGSPRVLLEVGPGTVLTGVVRPHPDRAAVQPVVSSLVRAFGESERAALLKAVAQIWLAGLPVDWAALRGEDVRRRIALPTYPFERRRFWIEPAGAPPREDDTPAEQAQAAESAKSMHPRPNLQNEYVAPRNERETAIVDIWQELFGIEPIGVYDNFFELGGHSLLGTQVVSRVRTALEVDVPVRVLFEGPTIADLAMAVETNASGSGPMEAIQRADRGDDAADLLARLDELSEEEMEALLGELSADDAG
jgi:acyl transferase domain-containing protein